jgi:hypothetical protein
VLKSIKASWTKQKQRSNSVSNFIKVVLSLEILFVLSTSKVSILRLAAVLTAITLPKLAG